MSESAAQFEPPSAAELSQKIGEKYEVLNLLGVGGMGAVYQARQPVLERLVAIKLLPPAADATGELSYEERFRREARAMAQLDHPNIVSVLEFGQTTDGWPYFVMEFVDGSDLHQLIHLSRLELSHVVSWMPLICQALEYAHGKGMVHRDIKPANILVAKDGRVKVADFGLVQLRADPATGESELGTVGYSAPEVFDPNLPVDSRADIFSLGILMYELFTGKPPEGSWVPPSQINSAIDPRYDDLILRCIQHDPAERFQSATQISSALTAIASQPLSTAQRAQPSPALIAGGAMRAPARKKIAAAKKASPSKKAPPPKKKFPVPHKRPGPGPAGKPPLPSPTGSRPRTGPSTGPKTSAVPTARKSSVAAPAEDPPKTGGTSFGKVLLILLVIFGVVAIAGGRLGWFELAKNDEKPNEPDASAAAETPARDPEAELARQLEEKYPMPEFPTIESLTANWTQIPTNIRPNLVNVWIEAEYLPVEGNSADPIRAEARHEAKLERIESGRLVVSIDPGLEATVEMGRTNFKDLAEDRFDQAVADARARVENSRITARKILETHESRKSPADLTDNSSLPQFRPAQSQLEAGELEGYAPAQVREWTWLGEERIDGKKYNVALVTFDRDTIFGPIPVMLKCLIDDGEVRKWIDAASGEEID